MSDRLWLKSTTPSLPERKDLVSITEFTDGVSSRRYETQQAAIARLFKPLRLPNRLVGALALTCLAALLPATNSLADTQPLYVSLSYDDALTSQLENAVPVLEKHGLRASFYLVPANPGFAQRKEDWKKVAQSGHELGNHSFTHPCRGSLTQREWVAQDNDMDKISANDMVEQVKRSNEVLASLDGKNRRTYTPPCGDRLAKGENYLDLLGSEVTAIKAYELPAEVEVTWAPQDVSAEQLIEFAQNQPATVRIINFIFHGIGGDYLSVSSQAHEEFVQFLAAHPDQYAVDTYLAIRDKMDVVPKPSGRENQTSMNER